MSNPNKQDELETWLFNIGASMIYIINGMKYYRIPGHTLPYSLLDLLEAYD